MKWILLLVFSCILVIACEKTFEPEQNKVHFSSPQLSQNENQKMSLLLNNIPEQTRYGFKIYFAKWEDTWDWDKYKPCSNPRCWTQSEQYQQLLNYCKSHGNKIWPLVFQKHLENKRDYLTSLLISDLTFQDFGYLVDDFYTKKQNALIEEADFWIFYIKEILNLYYTKTGLLGKL